jgi:hypothetical protein
MLKIKISYDDKKYEKYIHVFIELISKGFHPFKISVGHKYEDKKGHKRIHLDVK